MGRSPAADRPRRMLAAAALGAVFLAGCAPRRALLRNVRPDPAPHLAAPREGAGPLWEWQESADGHLAYRVLHPFVEGRRRPGGRMFVLRPLFSREDEGAGSTRWTFRALWPLVLIQRKDESGRARLLPLVWYRKRASGPPGSQEVDKDFFILPVLLAGSDTTEGRYFALWPAGGLVKGIFGKQYIRFVLWPLWVEGHDKHYHSWNAPWPIFGVWRGPKQRGWRLWPIYGTNQREGKFKRVFFLWPLGYYWNTGLDTKAPGKVRAFLPFWGKIENKHLRYVTVLWPLFGRKHNRKNGYVEWHCPWPIYSRTVGGGVRGLKVFPLYAHRFTPRSFRRSVLWKVYERSVVQGRSARRTTVRSLLIFQFLRDEWDEREVGGKKMREAPPAPLEIARMAAERAGRDPGLAGRKERPVPAGERRSRVNTLLWPVFRYRRSADGERYFTVLAPWWWRKSEVWDRHYGPFFTLYRYQRFADGSVRELALFWLYEHSRSPTERRVRLSPLFDYWRRGEAGDFKRFRVLGGLVGYERRGRGKRLRLLWIPLGRRPQEWERPEG